MGTAENNSSLIWYSDFQGSNNSNIAINQVNGSTYNTGNFVISSAIVKYGISSLYVNDSTGSNYMQIPSITLSGYDWCIAGWFYYLQYGTLFSHCSYNSASGFLVGVYTSLNKLQCYNSDTAWNGNPQIDQPPLNTWFHIAYTKQAKTYKLFLNGTSVGTSQTGTLAPIDPVTYIDIGYGNSSLGNPKFYCNSLAIYKGNSIYTSNFTPPGFGLAGFIPNFYSNNNSNYIGY